MIFEEKTVLPKGTYDFKYVSDSIGQYQNCNNKFITMVLEVISEDHKGELVELTTVTSSDNKKVNAIGNSIRNSVFKACIGEDNMSLFKEYVNTDIMYGKRFRCVVDQKEDNFDVFSPIKNTFKSFECILTDEEIIEISKDLLNRLG